MKQQIYFRYIRKYELSIEIQSIGGEFVVLIRQKNKAPIKEVLRIDAHQKGV